jgi:AdoMet-dependent heme synthase
VEERSQIWNRDFSQNPYIVIWEVTRACQLHCLHCRAEAERHRDPRELTTEEGFKLIDQIAELDKPLLVFTGGDPLERPDLYDFIRYARSKGLSPSMTPSATPKVTYETIKGAKDAGLLRWAFSLDGSTAQIHDKFRGTKGSYDLTIRSTGRAREQYMVTPEEHEHVMEWLYQLSKRSPFDIKTTAGPHYRRVVIQQRLQDKVEMAKGNREFLIGENSLRAAKGVNDGNGFVFISHLGDIMPSGFLPVKAGSIREAKLADVYRNSPIFQELRNPNLLKGKCGVCEFRNVCAGSRARAYAMTGDYLESDPSCSYIPKALTALA